MFLDIHPTKLAILNAAVKVFGEKGFSGATTKEIAQAAGVSEGTIFRHFANKTEVLHELVNSIVPSIGVETLEKTIEECKNMDAEQALQNIIQNRFDTIRESKVFMRIIFTEIQYDVNLRNIYVKRVYEPICAILRKFFEERMEKGEFKNRDPEMIINIFMSYILFSIETQDLLENVHKHEFLDQNASRAFADLLLEGIKGSEENDQI